MEQFIQFIHSFSEIVPITVFVFFGGIIEEVIAPIPSPVIMTFAGTVLSESNASNWYLLYIGFLGAVGKTLGSVVLYYLGYYLEVLFIEKFGAYFGLSKEKFHFYADKITNMKFPVFWIAILRSAPFIPSAPFSGLFGIIKFDLKYFFIGSLIGNFIRDSFYTFLGFYSFKNLEKIMNNFESLDSIITLFLIMVCLFGIFLLRKKVDKKLQ